MSKKGLEPTEPEKLDRTEKGRYRPTKRPAIIKDFDDEKLIGGTINFPENMYEALRRQAYDRGVTMGSIVREYITKGLAEGKEDEETREIEEAPQKGQILELLQDCIKEDGGFEIEGENGFLFQVEERKLVGKLWTNDLLKKAAEYYAVGVNGYFEGQDLNEHVERSSLAMKLSVKQKKIWAELLKSAIESPEAN